MRPADQGLECDPDVDWADAGMVVARSVSDHAQDRPAFPEVDAPAQRARGSRRTCSTGDTDKHYLRNSRRWGCHCSDRRDPPRARKHQIPHALPGFGEFTVSSACVISAATTVDGPGVRPPAARCRACWESSCWRHVECTTCMARFRSCFSNNSSPTPLRSARPAPPQSPTAPKCTRPW